MNTFLPAEKLTSTHNTERPSMTPKSFIDSSVFSSDLFSEVLDVQVKQRAKLSADHHLALSTTCILRIPKLITNRKSRSSGVAYTIK